MAFGDDATLANMTFVNGAAAGSAAAIDDYVNRAQDYVANGPVFWKPGVVCGIADGGTGATTAAAARTALGVPAASAVVGNRSSGTNVLELQWADMGAGGPHLQQWIDASYQGQLAKNTDIPAGVDISGKVNKSGDTMSGDLYIPGSSAAVSGFTVCYINSDGRISRGSSSERYKKYISPVDPQSVGDIFPQLVRYQMRSLDGTADGSWMLGYIAERLDEHNDTKRFVVRVNGEIESIDFIQLLLAQVANLNARLEALESQQ